MRESAYWRGQPRGRGGYELPHTERRRGPVAGLREGQLAIARNARLDCQVTGEIGDVP